MKSYPKLFFGMCLFAVITLSFLMILNFDEQEIVGWEFNVSRNLIDYIHKDGVTAKILPADFCDSPALVVIMCISSPSGFQPRNVIRDTWGKEKTVMGHNVSLYFLIGETDDLDVQELLEQEFDQHKDIIQEAFHDSYNNLTLKSAMMLKLFKLKCQKTASFLLKIDQDIYLNVPKLVGDLLMRNKTEDLLMGSVICGAKPIKNYHNKWYAGPKYMYAESSYPNYISGTSYCMSSDVPNKLLEIAFKTPIFHLEDVYLTGICARKIHLNLTQNNLFTYRLFDTNFCNFKPLITIHYQDPDRIQKLHHAMHDSDVERHCQEQEQVTLVHRWFMKNILAANKTWRRRACKNVN